MENMGRMRRRGMEWREEEQNGDKRTSMEKRGKAWLGIHSFQKNATFLRSFLFFIKERGTLCILYKRTQRSLRSFLFFIKERGILSVLYKRTERFLRSFPVFIKERNVLCILLCSFMFFIKEHGVLCVLLRPL